MTIAAKDPQCAEVELNLHPCAVVIQSGVLQGAPPTGCCGSLKQIKVLEASLGVQKMCQCIQDSLVFSHTVDGVKRGVNNANLPNKYFQDVAADISGQLQGACGVNLGVNAPCS